MAATLALLLSSLALPSHAAGVRRAGTVENPPCAPAAPATAKAGVIYVVCPLSTARVRGVQLLSFTAPGLTKVAVSAWSADVGGAEVAERELAVWPGITTTRIDLSPVPSGPVTVQIRPVAGTALSSAQATYFQVYNLGSPYRTAAVPRRSAIAAGKQLVYDDEFNVATSVSADGRGAQYAAAKPEYWGVSQFGDAIFPDPARGFDNLGVVDNRYLRLAVQPNPSGYVDPNGWGRRFIGGMLASARPGGSGFSARYGYFEARIASPSTPGTWPAFWLLPADNLVAPQPVVAEIDALEQYGQFPSGTCHTTHSYHDGRDDGVADCGDRYSSRPDALRWHVYGVSVEPTKIVFSIDGRVVSTAAQVRGGDKAMFFLLDLDLGGGWPVDLDRVQNRAAMYVDYVRVYR